MNVWKQNNVIEKSKHHEPIKPLRQLDAKLDDSLLTRTGDWFLNIFENIENFLLLALDIVLDSIITRIILVITEISILIYSWNYGIELFIDVMLCNLIAILFIFIIWAITRY